MTQRRPTTRSVSQRGSAYRSSSGVSARTVKREVDVSRNIVNADKIGHRARRKGTRLPPSVLPACAEQSRPATPITVSQARPYPAIIRVYHDTKIGGSPHLLVEGRDDLELASLAIKIRSHLDCMMQGNPWKILERQCFWQDGYGKKTDVQSMSNFSDEEWRGVLDRVEDACANTSQPCNTRFVVMVRAASLDSTHHDQSSQPSVQQPQDHLNPRVGRIPQTIPHREEAFGLGNLCHVLQSRYRCRDWDCVNVNGYCFVDLGLNHHVIEDIHMEQWARSLAAGSDTCSLSRPPADLYNYWIFTQGRATVDSRRSLLESAQLETEDLESKLHRIVDTLLKTAQIQMLQAASTSLRSCHCR